jgi:superfamily II DNA/RNA helicase
LTFKELGLNTELLKGIEALGYEEATTIQELVIPIIIQGKDILASAQTGTGKTAAFLLPIIQRIISIHHDDSIKALVLVPTRELAIQIEQQMEGFSYFTPVSSIAVYGGGDGTSFTREKEALTKGADVVICTPGRMIAHLNLQYVNLKYLQYLILDEADRMLDIGFHDDIMKIISYLPAKRQSLLFSATIPHKIRELSKKILNHPSEFNIAISKPPEKIKQSAYIVYETQKMPLLKQIINDRKLRSVLVFCSTKHSVRQLTRDLKRINMPVEEIHSDLEQNDREKVLSNFKNRSLNILIATDILSRGIDIEDIDMVINYDVPNDGEDYIHRIGRTARAEANGEAITFVTEKEQRRFLAIENILGNPVPKAIVPGQFGEVPEYNPKKSVHNNYRKKRLMPQKHNFKN